MTKYHFSAQVIGSWTQMRASWTLVYIKQYEIVRVDYYDVEVETAHGAELV